MSNEKAEMNKRITGQINKSKASKSELAALSRDLLTYVPRTMDAPAVLRLINGQSPATKKVAIQFFSAFVAWEFDEESPQYGKKKKDKIVASVAKKVEDALKDADFNLWTWYEAKGEKPTKKPKDHKKAVTNALVAGLKEQGENKITLNDLGAIFEAADLDMRKLMEICELRARMAEIK